MRWKRVEQPERIFTQRPDHHLVRRLCCVLVASLVSQAGSTFAEQQPSEPSGAGPPAPAPVYSAAVSERNPVGDFFAGVLSIPALPLRFVTAVENGATGIRETAVAGNRLADVAEKLPEKVRFEVEQMDQTFERFENISGSVERASTGFADAGEAWTGAIHAFDQTMQHLREPSDTSADTASGPAFDVRFVAQSTRGLADAAHEARLMMEQIDQIMASAALTRRLDQVSNGARQTLDQTTHSARSLIDHATWAVTRLLLMILAVGLAWRLGTRYLGRPADADAPSTGSAEPKNADHARAVSHDPPDEPNASDKTFDPNAPEDQAGYRYRDLVRISPFRLIRPDEVEQLRPKKVG